MNHFTHKGQNNKKEKQLKQRGINSSALNTSPSTFAPQTSLTNQSTEAWETIIHEETRL
jgi:hypothetical protein